MDRMQERARAEVERMRAGVAKALAEFEEARAGVEKAGAEYMKLRAEYEKALMKSRAGGPDRGRSRGG